MALDLKESGMAERIAGVDLNPDHIAESLDLGIIDFETDIEKGIPEADLVILAVPVDTSIHLLERILNNLGEKTIVMDVCSTKGSICKAVKNHPLRTRFVATHPIAGTENSGPRAAFKGLFMDKIALICDSHNSSDHALKLVHRIYADIGSKIIEMDPYEHDRHLAYVSHLSHISSFTLGLTVLDIEKNERNINMLAGSGFESTVRLAKSSPEMWAPIFLENKKDILTALDEYIIHLTTFRNLIYSNNNSGLNEQMNRANDIRRILD